MWSSSCHRGSRLCRGLSLSFFPLSLSLSLFLWPPVSIKVFLSLPLFLYLLSASLFLSLSLSICRSFPPAPRLLSLELPGYVVRQLTGESVMQVALLPVPLPDN